MKRKRGINRPVTYRGFGIRTHTLETVRPFATVIGPDGCSWGETDCVESRLAAVHAAQDMIDAFLDIGD